MGAERKRGVNKRGQAGKASPSMRVAGGHHLLASSGDPLKVPVSRLPTRDLETHVSGFQPPVGAHFLTLKEAKSGWQSSSAFGIFLPQRWWPEPSPCDPHVRERSERITNAAAAAAEVGSSDAWEGIAVADRWEAALIATVAGSVVSNGCTVKSGCRLQRRRADAAVVTAVVADEETEEEGTIVEDCGRCGVVGNNGDRAIRMCAGVECQDVNPAKRRRRSGCGRLKAQSLKNYPRHAAAKLQKRKLDEEQVISSHNLPGDPSTLKKATGIQAGLNNYINNNPAASQVANSSQQGGQALNSFQNMLRNTLNLKQNVLPEEALSSLSASKHAQPLQFQGSVSSVSIDASVSNLSGQHRQQPPLDVRLQQQYNLQNPQVNQHMQQHVIQQMLQEMMNNKGASQQSVIAPNANAGRAAGDVTGGDVTATPVMVDTGSIRNALELQSMQTNPRNNVTGGMGSRSYSFQSAAAASNPSISGNIINSRPDLPQNMGLPEMDHIAQEFAENGIFDPDSW
ncbi:hypothetical protein B296_00004775 [Ensete ventricosum]|uniref:Uncharacterized protein n=1 Tax=Ensete ventricosum TaxID=4639 RepID=A0A426YVB3_ENSVE|nr:hypothetical protein B296_00004775 [Ensete ventricosum]